MTFSDLFNVTYATPCGVQLGESFVKRPSSIGAGEWMNFWEQLICNYGEEEEISPHYVEQIEKENEDLRQENDKLNDRVAELEREIERLEQDCLEADYALGQRFGDQI